MPVIPGQKLIDWYRKEGRDLPWRISLDPYQIWLSEIILQQTRVEQGLPWFHSFMEKYPTVEHLAEASEGEVLKLWQGLGYYSRARNLLRTARIVCEEFNGHFPSQPEILKKLPGIGPYTAAAIASIAYNLPLVAMDGNLNRIAARFFAINDPIDLPSCHKLAASLVADSMPQGSPGEFNQALMDLGALICTPVNPACPKCPIAANCVGRSSGQQNQLPVRSPKTKPLAYYIHYFIFTDGTHILLRKRHEKGIWQNMYDLPGVESLSPVTAEQSVEFLTRLSGDHCPVPPLKPIPGTLRHQLSHRSISARFTLVSGPIYPTPPEYRWCTLGDLSALAIPRLLEKFMQTNPHIFWPEGGASAEAFES